jgi:hypothetical protein
MIVAEAAKRMAGLIMSRMSSEGTKPADRFHLLYMCDELVHERVTGEQAHRWLGWIQGVCVARDIATLDECKDINHVS